MKDLIQAVAAHLAGGGLAYPLIWENFAAAATMPRYEVRLGAVAGQTLAYSGLGRQDIQLHIDAVVTEAEGLATQLDMLDALLALLPVGTQLGEALLVRTPDLEPGKLANGEHRRRLRLTLRVLV